MIVQPYFLELPKSIWVILELRIPVDARKPESTFLRQVFERKSFQKFLQHCHILEQHGGKPSELFSIALSLLSSRESVKPKEVNKMENELFTRTRKVELKNFWVKFFELKAILKPHSKRYAWAELSYSEGFSVSDANQRAHIAGVELS